MLIHLTKREHKLSIINDGVVVSPLHPSCRPCCVVQADLRLLALKVIPPQIIAEAGCQTVCVDRMGAVELFQQCSIFVERDVRSIVGNNQVEPFVDGECVRGGVIVLRGSLPNAELKMPTSVWTDELPVLLTLTNKSIVRGISTNDKPTFDGHRRATNRQPRSDFHILRFKPGHAVEHPRGMRRLTGSVRRVVVVVRGVLEVSRTARRGLAQRIDGQRVCIPTGIRRCIGCPRIPCPKRDRGISIGVQIREYDEHPIGFSSHNGE